MKRTKLWSLILVLAAPLLVAAEPDAGEVLDGLQAWLDESRTLQGRFEQELLSGALGAGIEESGRIYIERPGRMRWDYLEPERKVAIVDGDRTTLFLEEDLQLMLGRLEGEGDLLPALLAGQGRLDSLFEASLVPTEASEKRGSHRLLLVPRRPGEVFENVELALGRRDFGIIAAVVLDAGGNRLFYRFFELERNRDLPTGIFSFEPPEGTAVSGEH